MPVHMLGNSCDMDAIMAIANKRGLPVIEDVCQANGGSYQARKLGAIGRMGTFSLNIFKTVTAGDGGIVVTDDTGLYKLAFGIKINSSDDQIRQSAEFFRKACLP